MAKKRVFSGIQPSGNLHIGNYFGAILTWVREQDEKENIFCIVDEHAITVPQDPKDLKKRILELAKTYIAAGIDTNKSCIFVQSSRSEHAELGWILNCFTYLGELRRMTQFKDKVGLVDGAGGNLAHEAYRYKNGVPNDATVKEIWDAWQNDVHTYQHFLDRHYLNNRNLINISAGLFNYPTLMAADILLYDTDEVPVGEDQKQHVELTRDIAERINNRFGKILTVPAYYTVKEATRIMSLTDPTKKMSKSDKNENSRIEILDTPEIIRKKFARAVTDSGSEIKFDKENKPGISNLLNILSVCTNTSIKELEKKYKDTTYGEFKKDVAEAVIKLLEPFQIRYHELNDDYVINVLKEGAAKVEEQAKATLKRVKDAVGLGI